MLLVMALIASLAASAAPEAPAGKGAANDFARTADDREGALDSFTNTGTDDSAALLKQLQQEIYVNQQLAILIQFRLDCWMGPLR